MILDKRTVEAVDGEPRASAFQLAELLGFGRARDIKKIIERNREELAVLGEIPCRATVARQATGFGEREYEVQIPWLNRTQCLIVAMKVDTPTAVEASASVVRYDARRCRRTDALPRVVASAG